MILTVIRGKELDLQLAGIAATAICGAGLTRPFQAAFHRATQWLMEARWKLCAIRSMLRGYGQGSSVQDSRRSRELPTL